MDIEAAKAGRDFASILAGVRQVAAKAAERRDEIDTDRAFPADLYDEIEQTGAFKLCGPAKFGGLELTLAEANEVVFEGARGLGSLGWLMMVGVSQSIGGGLYPEETIEKNYSTWPNLRSRGVIAPKGQAVPVKGGYRVSGQWPFASGGPKPNIVSGHCIVMEDGKPKIGSEGTPESIMAMMPAKQVEFLDNWHTIGMRGTDSCDVRARDIFVPHACTFNLMSAQTCFDTPAARLPLRVALSFSHCALALGIAQGALDDIVELARTKLSAMNPAALLGNDPLFRDKLGRNRVQLTGLRSMLKVITENCWQAGVEQRELTPEQILTARVMSSHITEHCLEIVSWAYTAGGSSVVYDGSSLQTRLRDIHVARQHASCSPEPYRLLAAVMLGEELSPRELF